jgi:RHS repeat-associated protein
VWASPTGKEEDVEVGLTYFGKRYLNTHLQRWISPDPLQIHSGGADPNLYAYVSGQALKNVDPLGLDDEPATDAGKIQSSLEDAANAEVGGGSCGGANANMSCGATETDKFLNSTSNLINRAQPGDLDPREPEKSEPPEQVTDDENWKRAVKNEAGSVLGDLVGVVLLSVLGGEGAQDALDASDAAEGSLHQDLGESPNKGLIQTTVTVGAVVLPGLSGELRTARGAGNSPGRVFWSGGESAKQAGASFAQRTGGTTLEMTEAGRALEAAKLPWSEAKTPWQSASREFAAGAQGRVDVFMSKVPRPDSIWSTVERGALQANPVVTELRYHLTVLP